MNLLSQEELEVLCPGLTEEIAMFVNGNPGIEGKDEAVIYALAQNIQNKLDTLSLSQEDKGFVVSVLIQGLVFFNSGPLALHQERLRTEFEAKEATKH